ADGEWGLWNGGGELPTTRLLRNVGGRFEDVSDEWGAAHATRANGCVAADFDGDGFTDLYVTTSRANLLLWNEGGSGFVERGTEAGVDTYGWHTGAAAGDLDGDGLVDLVVAGYADLNRRRPDASTGFPNTFEPIDDVVLLNQGDRTFRPVTRRSGIEPDGPEYGLGVVLVDLDVDGDLDVHVANDTQPNRVYLNESSPGDVRLVDVSATSGADDPNSGMGIGTGDLNADGRPDLVVTNLAGQGHASLASSGVDGGTPVFAPDFEEVRSLGLAATGWGASFGDLDLDGDLDLLVASGSIPIESLGSAAEPLAYFCNTETGLVESTADVGLGALEERNGRGIALADYDNDGDLDAAVSAIGEPLALLENRGARGNWVSVDAGVPVPGLRVRAELTDGATIERITAVGGSWLSSEDPRIHVGLGDADGVELLTVTWPDGRIDQVRGVEAGQVVLVG
ncbi:MAG: CRTAC1 family protein, partial [Actinomycetota bacterium]